MNKGKLILTVTVIATIIMWAFVIQAAMATVDTQDQTVASQEIEGFPNLTVAEKWLNGEANNKVELCNFVTGLPEDNKRFDKDDPSIKGYMKVCNHDLLVFKGMCEEHDNLFAFCYNYEIDKWISEKGLTNAARPELSYCETHEGDPACDFW